MEEMMFDRIPGLESLLKNKNFSQLPEQEKSLVLQYMSQPEYEALRLTTREAGKLFLTEASAIQLDPGMKQILLAKFGTVKEEGRNSHIYPRLFLTRIPLYQVGIAAVLLIALFLFIGEYTFFHRNTEIQYVDKPDTIFITKTVAMAALDTARQLQEPGTGHGLRMETASTVTGDTDYSVVPMENYADIVRNAEHLLNMNRKSRKGCSAVDDSLLMKLLVTVN
jgi:hypothetical protein